MLLKAATGNNATTPRPRESDSTQRSNDRSLATILVGIVLVFMVCHACRFFLAFYQVHVTWFVHRKGLEISDKCIFYRWQ